MYADGRGVGKDYKAAVDWFWKAAAQGHADAQAYLGTMYQNGHGVAKDMNKAVEWYRKAAAQGNVFAKDILKRLGK